jgi:hypothetical protein
MLKSAAVILWLLLSALLSALAHHLPDILVNGQSPNPTSPNHWHPWSDLQIQILNFEPHVSILKPNPTHIPNLQPETPSSTTSVRRHSTGRYFRLHILSEIYISLRVPTFPFSGQGLKNDEDFFLIMQGDGNLVRKRASLPLFLRDF